MNPITSKCLETQPFGMNYNDSYKNSGLKGHTGRDHFCGYGTNITAYFGNEYVYKVLTKDNPANDGSGFTGVFTLVEQDGECFEFLYGHCNPTVSVGQILARGEVLGTEANNGEVYSGGVRITLEMQKAGDTRGSHRHDQKRPLNKVTGYDNAFRYLTDKYGLLLKDGYMYQIKDYDNGFNGCVDWSLGQPKDTPFITMQKAILAFQLSEGLLDFQSSPLTEVAFGTKTRKAANKYMTKNKYK
jgi:hypothetical protein